MMAYKRPRETFSQSSAEVAAIIIDLNQAVATSQRTRVLRRLLPLAEVYAPALIQSGAIRALCLQIGFVLNKSTTSIEELGLVCSGVDALLRNSSEFNIDGTMNEIGDDLLNVLKKALERERALAPLVLSIWRMCAGCITGSNKLITSRHGFLTAVLSTLRGENVKKRTIDEVVGVLKNLTHYAEDYRGQIFEHPHMIVSLCRIPLMMTITERASDRLSAVLRNLALTPHVRLEMAQEPNILSVLVHLCGQTKNPKTVRNSLGTICSLAMEMDSSVTIVLHGDGIILNILLHFLASACQDEVIRKRAVRTIKLLAREKTIPLLINSPELLQKLYESAVHDTSAEVRSEAAEAFSLCSAKIDAEMPKHSEILACLIGLANGVAPEAVSLALDHQSRNQSNRITMGTNVDLLNALAFMALKESASSITREHVTQAFMNLSTEESVRNDMAIEPVLRVLVRNASTALDHRELADTAVRALLNLASLESNRRAMVTHVGLLKALMGFASSCLDESAKKEVKKTILALVPLL